MEKTFSTKVRLIKRSVALEFLGAQVATGGLVNPKTGEKQDLSAATQLDWIPRQLEVTLLESEKAFKGFIIAGYSGPVPLVEAIRVGIVAEMQGTRLLEAQVATGGLVDPTYGYRVPLDVAKKNGLIDSRVAGLIDNPLPEHKGYVNPETGENATYEELLSKCTKRNGITLFPLSDRATQFQQANQMIFLG